jgi:polysaccharide export outer membrane protein
LTVRIWLGVLGLSAIVAGCQAVPGDGPWMNGAKAGSTEAFPFDVIDLTPTTVVAYRPEKIRASATGNASAATRLTASPGDVLRVRIFERYPGGIFPTVTNPAALPLGNQIVSPAGTIDVPYVGAVKVAGLDLRQIEHRIEGRLAGQAKEPQVIAEFAADRTNTVTVSGSVKQPGRLPMTEGVRTVLDAINRAGGVAQPGVQDDGGQDGAASTAAAPANVEALADQPAPPPSGPSQLEVVVRRDGRVILARQLSELLAGADIAVEKGDEIVVRPNSQVITVLGAVAKAGNVPVTKPNMTLADALGEVGGLIDLRANKTGLYVFRLGDVQDNPHARARIFRLDFMQPVSVFVAQQFGVQPKDVIFVANAPLREYDKVLESLYRTAVIVGVGRGSVIPAVQF